MADTPETTKGKRVRFSFSSPRSDVEKGCSPSSKSTPSKNDQPVNVAPSIIRATKRNPKDVGEMFDELTQDVGGCGRYQHQVVFFIILPIFFSLAFIQGVLDFVLSVPSDYWCRIPELEPFPSQSIGSNIPLISTNRFAPLPDNASSYLKCSMYAANFTELLTTYGSDLDALEMYLKLGEHNLPLSGCIYGWNYETSLEQYDVSVITEWDVVCEYEYLQNFIKAILIVASIIGILSGGYIADRFGRRTPLFIFMTIFLSFGVAFAFSPSLEAFIILAIFYSFGMGPVYYILYTTGVEILTAASRVSFVVWLSIYSAAGSMTFTILAYFVRDWRKLGLYGIAPFFILLLYCFWFPESPRWLLVKEKFRRLEEYFHHIAEKNGRKFDDEKQIKLMKVFEQCEREVNIEYGPLSSRRSSWTKLFITLPMLKKTVLLTYLLSILHIVYFGLRSYMPNVGGVDGYFTYFISHLVDIPGYALMGIICDRFGRRISVSICFALAFLTCLITLAFPTHDHYKWGMMCVFLIARIFIAAAFVVGELIVYETYPTVIRVQGVALCQAIAFIFHYVGPQIVKLQFHSAPLPLIIFGCLALLAVIGVFLLPETLSSALPDTLEEADLRGNTFRKAVNYRVPSFRFKPKPPAAEVQYKKKEKPDGYVPVSSEAPTDKEEVRTASAHHEKVDETYSMLPPQQGSRVPVVTTIPSSEIPSLDKPDAPAPLRYATASKERNKETQESSKPPGEDLHEIAKVRASLKRGPRSEKFERDIQNASVSDSDMSTKY